MLIITPDAAPAARNINIGGYGSRLKAGTTLSVLSRSAKT
jgi:hypothetical protein